MSEHRIRSYVRTHWRWFAGAGWPFVVNWTDDVILGALTASALLGVGAARWLVDSALIRLVINLSGLLVIIGVAVVGALLRRAELKAGRMSRRLRGAMILNLLLATVVIWATVVRPVS